MKLETTMVALGDFCPYLIGIVMNSRPIDHINTVEFSPDE